MTERLRRFGYSSDLEEREGMHKDTLDFVGEIARKGVALPDSYRKETRFVAGTVVVNGVEQSSTITHETSYSIDRVTDEQVAKITFAHSPSVELAADKTFYSEYLIKPNALDSVVYLNLNGLRDVLETFRPDLQATRALADENKPKPPYLT